MSHCCFIPEHEQGDESPMGCPSEAEFLIRDLEDSDPYVRETEACTEHVGALLGHAEKGNWREGMPQRWEVEPL